jgi:hypothetical protein
MVRALFVIFCESSVAPEPSEGAFDDPPLGYDRETGEVVISFYNLKGAKEAIFRPCDKLAGVPSVGPDELETSETLSQEFEDPLGPVAVLEGSLMDDEGNDQPERVHPEMAFSSVDFLAGIVPAQPPFSVVLTD